LYVYVKKLSVEDVQRQVSNRNSGTFCITTCLSFPKHRAFLWHGCSSCFHSW